MALPVWKLHVITRCESLQALLSSSEDTALDTALFQPPMTSSTTSNARLQHHECDALVTPAAIAATAADAHGGGATQSNHLERWKQWKLDDAHIQRLTSAQGVDVNAATASSLSTANSSSSPPLAFLSDWITNARFFARGKRGVLYAGELQSNGIGVVVKLGAASVESNPNATTLSSVDAEAKWLRVMNRMGLGAQLVASGPGWFICERLEGQNVVDFLGSGSASSHANARWVLREMLCQCFAMDLMGINKEEMTHPHRHIIIHTRPAAIGTFDPKQLLPSSQREWKCTFVDFEKCVYTRKPKNVTQLCQFLSSPRMVALLGAKGVAFEIPTLRLATKKYKQSPQEHTFGELMRVFEL